MFVVVFAIGARFLSSLLTMDIGYLLRPKVVKKTAEVCDLIHADVGGPTHILTFDNFRFYSLFKDDHSSYTDVKLIKKKNGAVDHIIEFYERMKNQTSKQVKILRTDQGREYEGERMENWKKQNGIIHQSTNRYTPQQNGVSERTNRTLMDGVRSSMYNNNHSNQLSHNTGNHLMKLWGEFLCATVYIRNRSINSHSDITPYDKVFGKKPSVDHLRILGCRAYAHVPDPLRRKLEPKAVACWLVGYCDNIKGGRLWYPVNRKVIISRDVTFDETTLIGDTPDAAKEKLNPCEPFQVVMNVLNVNSITRHEEHQNLAGLKENESVEPIINDVINRDVPAGSTTPPEVEQAVDVDMGATEPAVLNQKEDTNVVDGQQNYRRSQRVRLMENQKSQSNGNNNADDQHSYRRSNGYGC